GQQPLDVLDHRVAVIAGLADRGVGIGAERHRVRAVDARYAQLAERRGDRGRVLADVGGQAHRRVAGSLADAVGAGRRVALEDRAVFGEGYLPGRVLDRLPVGVLRPSFDVVDLLAAQRERRAQLHDRRDLALPGDHALAGRVDVAHPAGPHRGEPLAGGPVHVDQAAAGQGALARARGLPPALGPGP